MEKVLIVDDEENIRYSFGAILFDEGFEVVKAKTIDDARFILATTVLDVALVDRLLGSQDGLTLIEDINKVQPHCTSILVSAFPTFKSAAAGMNHNLFAYLEKPVKKHKLCRTVKAAVQKAKEKKQNLLFEQQLIQTQKLTAMGMVASGMIHDFNNLFSAAMGYADLAKRRLEEQAPFFEEIERIKTVSNRGAGLSRKCLNYLKTRRQERQTVDIESIIRESIDLLKIMLPESIRISDAIGEGRHMVHVQPLQIEQSMINIGLNAMHAIGDHTGAINIFLDAVELDTDQKRKLGIHHTYCIRISVQDTGCGMDKRTLEQAFTPFFSTRNNDLGTGIGLSTSYKFIKDHGGGIDVKSKPDAGSLFRIYLPLYTPNRPDKEPDCEYRRH